MSTIKGLILSVGLLSAISGPTFASRWVVGHEEPHDFTTLAAACSLAVSGDSILVNPGEYNEQRVITVDQKTLYIGGTGAAMEDAKILHSWIYFHNCEQTLIENLCFAQSTMIVSLEFVGGTGAMRRCSIRDNSNPPDGAVVVYDASVDLDDCLFVGNTGEFGGALRGARKIRNCLFEGNTSTSDGGAVFMEGDDASIEDCVFVGNSAPQGAAVYAIGGSIRRCTFYGNAGDGAIYWAGGDYGHELENNIIAKTVGGFGAVCRYYGEFHCCDFWANDAGVATGVYFVGDLYGDITDDPLLCGAETGDFTLAEGSLCLPGHHGAVDCDRIGARDLGCTVQPTQDTTWGRLKLLFR
jgi:predicted outer membrane repeat protein